MKIDDARLQHMFFLAGISKDALHAALRQMGPAFLKTAAFRKEWSADNPTRNFCYVVSEFVYYYLAPLGSKAYGLVVPGDAGLHRFVKWPDQTIVDLTCDQFPDYGLLDYSRAVVRPFLPVQGKAQPSRRARHLGELLGYATPRTRS